MTLHIHNVTFDCADARALGSFWGELLGWNVYYGEDPEVVVAASFPSSGLGLLFIPLPEGNEFCIERGAAETGPRRSRAFRING